MASKCKWYHFIKPMLWYGNAAEPPSLSAPSAHQKKRNFSEQPTAMKWSKAMQNKAKQNIINSIIINGCCYSICVCRVVVPNRDEPSSIHPSLILMKLKKRYAQSPNLTKPKQVTPRITHHIDNNNGAEIRKSLQRRSYDDTVEDEDLSTTTLLTQLLWMWIM